MTSTQTIELVLWIDDIADPPRDAYDAAWSACVILYVHAYRYVDVPALFKAFDHDIRIEGSLFTSFLEATTDDRLGGAHLQTGGRIWPVARVTSTSHRVLTSR